MRRVLTFHSDGERYLLKKDEKPMLMARGGRVIDFTQDHFEKLKKAVSETNNPEIMNFFETTVATEE